MVRGLAAILWLAVAAGAVACGPSKAEEAAAAAARAKEKVEAVKRLAPSVKRKVAQVDELKKSLASLPQAAPDAKVPTGAPPIKLMELHYRDADANADVMMSGDLTLLQRGIIGSCNYHVRNDGDRLDSAYDAEKILGGCSKVRYFLVVRPDEKVKAKLAGSDTYTGGEITGDVVVFELPEEGSPKSLGSFPINVTLTGTVKIRADADGDRIEYELNEALRKQLLEAIEKKLAG